MNKTDMIDAIVDDLGRWLETDYEGALQHFQNLERQRLKKRTYNEVKTLYEDVVQ